MAALDEDNQAVLKYVLYSELLSLSCLLQNENGDLDIEYARERVEDMPRHAVLLDSISRVSECVFSSLFEARDLLVEAQNVNLPSNTSVVTTGRVGRPSYEISKEQLEFLIDCNFKIQEISTMIGVSKRTIERSLANFGITRREKFSAITDADLDIIVQEIKVTSPNCGSKLLQGYIHSRGICVQRKRVRESLSRIDPLGVQARKCRCVHRRTYNITRPLALRWEP